MQIINRDRYPNVNFLPDDQIRIAGDAEGIPIALIGVEQGTDAPVVSKVEGDLVKANLFAVPLYELLSHTYGAVNIAEDVIGTNNRTE